MPHVRKLWIEGRAGRLEAMLRVACPARGAALLSHPHPQHGGTLHNPVVFHSDRELHRQGFSTLRFNFRGVQDSDGHFDEGVGELDDVSAATDWLRGIAPGLPLLLVGYSFGSWCSFRHAAEDDRVSAVIGIGLPVRMYEFDFMANFGRPVAVVQGSEDEFGTPEMVADALQGLEPAALVHRIDGTSHLFPDRAREAAGSVVAAALDALGMSPL